MKYLSLYTLIILISCNSDQPKPSATDASAGGPDAPKSLITDTATLSRDLFNSRAFETVIWGMPIVNSDRMFQAMKKAGGNYNQLVYWSGPSDWKNQTLTPNGDAMYFMPFINTKEAGPMVLEIPPAGEGSIVGSLMDYWQMAIEDIGTAGIDKGKGGKFLILPPDHSGTIPPGYIPMRSYTYQTYALLRSIPKSTSEADTKTAVEYGKRIKLYPFSQKNAPPNTTLIDVRGQVFDATIPYDASFFESLNNMIQLEPWLERDRVMINILQTIGIEKGKPYAAATAKAAQIAEAAQKAKVWLANYYETSYEPFFPSSKWFLPADPALIKATSGSYADRSIYPLDSRACTYYAAFSGVKHLGAGQFYLFVSRDKNNNILDGSKNYKLHVPPSVPVNQYWSLTLYDFDTHAFIRDVAYPSRSSLNPAIKKNADGSVDIYVGPEAPEGSKDNWIPTRKGGRFEGLFRLYGPTEAFFEKKVWVLPDFEAM
jgi:hypothetical protein